MRHLVIRRKAARPAIRACLLAIILGTMALPEVGAGSHALAQPCNCPPVPPASDTGQDLLSPWTPRLSPQVGAAETVPSLSTGLLDDPGLTVEPNDWPLAGSAFRSAVQPATYVDSDWLRSKLTSTDVGEVWRQQILPDGLIYRSYLAGAKEPRFAGQWVHDTDLGWIWDITLGGRVGVMRYGTTSTDHPEGWQVDIEGAGMPRLDLIRDRDVISTDFRFGIPFTYGRGQYQTKLAYYHLSSHLGDEYMVRHQTLQRRNYSRDVIVWGHSFYLNEDLRIYGEAGWAFAFDGGSEPWEFQFGFDYSPARPEGLHGSPFLAMNCHLRQEFDFGGNLVVQTGWQWRGYAGHLFRTGMHYFQGMSDQWEFFDQYEDKLGFGIWYDY